MAHRRRTAGGGRDVEHGPGFVGTGGGWIQQSNLNGILKKLLKRARRPKVRPYDLRRTAATLLLPCDVNIRAVSEWLGHEDVGTNLRFRAHAPPSMLRRAVRVAQELFGDCPTAVPQGYDAVDMPKPQSAP